MDSIGGIGPADKKAKDDVLDVIMKEVIKPKNPEDARSTTVSTSTTDEVIKSYHNESAMIDVTKLMSNTTSSTSTTTENIIDEDEDDSNSSMPRCPEIPSNLQGKVPVNLTMIDMEKIEQLNLHVSPGGEYSPDTCRARHHVAIVVPYRDRAEQLAVFLKHIHPFLSKQELHYRKLWSRIIKCNKFISLIDFYSDYSCKMFVLTMLLPGFTLLIRATATSSTEQC